MAIEITPANAMLLNATLVTLFEDGAAAGAVTTSNIMDLAYLAPSDSSENIYTFAPDIKGLNRRPKGSNEVKVDAAKLYDSKIENDTFYRTFEIPVDDFEDDKIGRYKALMFNMGVMAATGPSFELEDTVANAENILAFDDVGYFSTDHPVKPKVSGSATWSNLITKASGLTFTTFAEVLALMKAFPSEDGKSAGSKPNILAVGPANYSVAMDIAKNEFPSSLSGGRNIYFNQFEVMEISNWTEDAWYLFDTRLPINRPFVFQERKACTIYPDFDLTSESALRTNVLRWNIKGRYAAGVGYPAKGVKVVKS